MPPKEIEALLQMAGLSPSPETPKPTPPSQDLWDKIAKLSKGSEKVGEEIVESVAVAEEKNECENREERMEVESEGEGSENSGTAANVVDVEMPDSPLSEAAATPSNFPQPSSKVDEKFVKRSFPSLDTLATKNVFVEWQKLLDLPTAVAGFAVIGRRI